MKAVKCDLNGTPPNQLLSQKLNKLSKNRFDCGSGLACTGIVARSHWAGTPAFSLDLFLGPKPIGRYRFVD